ncbi:MAG: hypothetical protein ACR2JG_04535, partial [Geodermatophilaceae bacterium]
SRVPAVVGRRFAGLLTAATGPYDWINYVAGVGGARVVSLERTSRWMRHDAGAVLRWADNASDQDLDRGMAVPPGWDPYFKEWMSRRDFLEWAPKHYRHHRAQLTMTVASADVSSPRDPAADCLREVETQPLNGAAPRPPLS